MKIPFHRSSLLFAAGLSAFALSASASPVSLGQKLKTDGIITGRAGASLALKTQEGNLVVLLTENTDVQARKGRLGLIKKEAAATALIPGLKVGVEGIGDDKGQLLCTKLHFTTGDLETARAIQGGLAETGAKVEANQAKISQVEGQQAELEARFGLLGDYDLKAEATVYFAVGSAAIPAEGDTQLAQLAASAKELKGYLIGVEGYADASGSATVNQKLSLDRSQAVVSWLAQKGGIPFVRMLAPGAMSTAAPVASNETQSGRAQNRRVVVKVLVNRGLAEP
ncbi:MAG TPA: OmpA family protein [Vicinamibacteria bacterium]